MTTISRLDGWPLCSPANASPTSSRTPAQGLGPMWVATPSSQWTLTTYSLPVSRRTYATLLAPVESGWKDARSLVVVTNGALGELPLGLLPTASSSVDL